MTKEQSKAITIYLNKGMSKKEISEITGLPLGTVKSFCSRHKAETSASVCEFCGKPVVQKEHRKKKRFCSDRCRLCWWSSPAGLSARKVKKHICPSCGRSFLTGKNNQVFCSRPCFAASRRKTNEQ